MFQPDSERNYHIFYQLCAGCPAAERKDLGLFSSTEFNYLNQGRAHLANVDDAAEFTQTSQALSTLGLSVNNQWMLFRIMAGILHLGNMSIADTDSDGSDISNTAAYQNVIRLLGLDESAFKRAITTRVPMILCYPSY